MTTTPTDEDRNVLQKLEEDLWRTETRFDIAYMETLFAEDFYEIGRSGRIHSRKACLSISKEPINCVFPLPDFDVRLLTEDIAQVTYNSAVTYDGIVEKGRRSSIWSRTDQGWILRFHQGTPYDSVGE